MPLLIARSQSYHFTGFINMYCIKSGFKIRTGNQIAGSASRNQVSRLNRIQILRVLLLRPTISPIELKSHSLVNVHNCFKSTCTYLLKEEPLVRICEIPSKCSHIRFTRESNSSTNNIHHFRIKDIPRPLHIHKTV